jgi:glyoxylase-like metal-dependent hydrolase (beta-lactamase superfamily II)
MLTRRGFMAAAAATVAASTWPQTSHALDLGGVSVEVMTDGGFSMPLSILSSTAPRAELLAALGLADGGPQELRSPLNVSLVRRGERLTLIDCGSGDRFLPGSGELLTTLEKAGIDREAVTDVLFTHAHPDHFWGAVDNFDDIAFPKARFHIAEDERNLWSAPDIATRLPADREMFAAGATRILKALGDRLVTFKPGGEVAPGIQAVATPGHTPGHVAFQVQGSAGGLMVLGDALTHRIVSVQHPQWVPGSDMDGAQGAATRLKLLDRLAADKLACIGYHFAEGGFGRVERAGAGYRLAPA